MSALAQTAEAQITRHESGGVSYLLSPARAGLPLVLLHGIGSASDSFVPLMRTVGPARPVLAWDAPGYGASRALDADWPRAHDYALVLGGLLDALGWERVALLGHSLGALTATQFALLAPKRVVNLTLVSPALGYAGHPGAPLPAPVAARLEALERLGPQRFAAERGARLVHRSDERPGITAAVIDVMSRVSPAGYTQASRMLACGDLITDAAQLTLPAEIIVGAEDVITPPDNARKLFAALRAARPGLGHSLTVIEDAGHAICQEMPESVALHLARAQNNAGRA